MLSESWSEHVAAVWCVLGVEDGGCTVSQSASCSQNLLSPARPPAFLYVTRPLVRIQGTVPRRTDSARVSPVMINAFALRSGL